MTEQNITQYFKANFNTIEIGTQSGEITGILCRMSSHVTTIDEYTNDSDGLMEAHSIYSLTPFTNLSRLKHNPREMSDNFSAGCMDAVVFNGSESNRYLLPYLPKIKEGGYICGDTFNKEVIDALGDNPEYSDDGFWIYHKINLPKKEYDPAEAYDVVFDNDAEYNSPLEDRFDYIDSFVSSFKNGSKFLDAGCGRGNNVRRLIQDGYNVYGIEFSQVCCNRYLTDVPHECIDIISYSKTKHPYYDGIINTDLLEHIPLLQLDPTLTALKKLGKRIFFGIANHSDVKRGYELHLIQEGLVWWERKLREFWVDVKFIDVHNTIYYIFQVE